ncbi:NAD(P)/FAD-dependent oxidoreductase [Hydrogenophaga sp. OTU3427]|uniref:NAD(P)/FAD-dependent oxidoreductase n=1 Tax=Hydrogenophaga sp. OTU3427 TaxID=3043856 RepID=UPI00313D61CE
MTTNLGLRPAVAIVGGGPAGLMAAEVLSAAGVPVQLFDAMPTVGRKFLLAGIGGLNLTHAEAFDAFVSRYAERAPQCRAWLSALGPDGIRAWAHGLGINTFVGSSQRVFPTDMKAAPLLRAWLHRLRHPEVGEPVRFHMRHRWLGEIARTPEGGWRLGFDTPNGPRQVEASAVVLALGGGSWAKLGSDGRWVDWLGAQAVDVAPLRPSNCGFDVSVNGRVGWSALLAERHAGEPLKSVALSLDDGAQRFSRKGEFVLTRTGIEGSLVYALSALARDTIARDGQATVYLNLRPDMDAARVLAEVAHPRGSRSLSSHLKSRLKLGGLHTTLLHELLPPEVLHDPVRLAAAIQHLPIALTATRPLDEAISSAGGVRLEALDEALMSRQLPGLFCAGEMLDWEAPTGGYLLSACLASGRVAGRGATDWWRRHGVVTSDS